MSSPDDGDGSGPTDGDGSGPTDGDGSGPTDGDGEQRPHRDGDPNEPEADDPDPAFTSDQEDEDQDPEDPTGPTEGPGGREVVLPMRLYKTVTVMGTLLAMVCIVGGFVVLDTATNRANAPISEIDPVLALFGLGLIVGGAGTYALSTRFRAAGMGEDDG